MLRAYKYITHGNIATRHTKKVVNITNPLITYKFEDFIPILDKIPLRETNGVLASIRYTKPKKQSPRPPLRY
jgi:hypothetical protein